MVTTGSQRPYRNAVSSTSEYLVPITNETLNVPRVGTLLLRPEPPLSGVVSAALNKMP